MIMRLTSFLPLLFGVAASISSQENSATDQAIFDDWIKQKRIPDTRRLEENVKNDQVEDGIVIEFNPSKQANGNTEGGKVLIKQLDDREEIAQRAQGLLEQLPMCTSARPTFRDAGIHQKDHLEFGLQYFYEFECPSPLTASTTTSNNTAKNTFGQKPESTKGQNALAAIHKVKDIMLDEHKLKSQKSADDANENYFNINNAVAMQKVENKEYLGEVAPEPVITEQDHPELWARQQQQEEEKQHRRLNEANVPKDKYFSIGYQSHYSAIDLQGAWDYLAQRDAWRQAWKVVVHVLDSGWQLSHEDAGVNIWRNRKETCGNGKDDDGNGYKDDCFGYNFADDKGNRAILGSGDHGSHVAGTIAANTDNNGKGVAGVAGGGSKGNKRKARGVSIMTGVGFGKQRTGGFAESIVYAADNGAMISSNSWGFTDPDYEDPAVRRAIRYAVRKGVLVLFAAGNDNSNLKYYPAAMREVISVAATYNNGARASFSNSGDIAAPGTNVLSTSTGGMYKFKSGTSMACPHVAGVVAMGKALHRQTATRAVLKQCLLNTAQDLGDPWLGKGMVNPIGFFKCLDRRLGRRELVQENDDMDAGLPYSNSTTTPRTTTIQDSIAENSTVAVPVVYEETPTERVEPSRYLRSRSAH